MLIVPVETQARAVDINVMEWMKVNGAFEDIGTGKMLIYASPQSVSPQTATPKRY